MTEAVTPPNSPNPGATQGPGSSQSVPDPTLMTIDALRREIAMLENLINAQLNAAETLTAERFHSMDKLMDWGEEQRREQKADTKAAVDAALDSQKEATTKMEKSISDQISSLKSNFETSIESVQSNVADLKDRMTTLESIKQGQAEQRTESRAITSGQIAAIGIGVTVLLAVLTIIAFIASSSPLPPTELSTYPLFYT